jgi:hypothetical protein
MTRSSRRSIRDTLVAPRTRVVPKFDEVGAEIVVAGMRCSFLYLRLPVAISHIWEQCSFQRFGLCGLYYSLVYACAIG